MDQSQNLESFKNAEFTLYDHLSQLSELYHHYQLPAADCGALEEQLLLIRNRTFRVAVIGEFKRGKSTLINAIIGAEVLPADIVPATATINRITYGDAPSVQLHYHNSETRSIPIESLVDYVTKISASGAKEAERIAEAVITYPSVVCQNHVDIYDTPGLSDDDSMTALTMSILDRMDAAIVVISALSPFASTEAELTAQLIQHPNINHLFFVVTMLDGIEPERQDELLDNIRGRIAELAREAVRFKSPLLLPKADRMLAGLQLFGVSAKDALKAFASNDRQLLKSSRFESFKSELYRLLTASQGSSLLSRASRAIVDASSRLEEHISTQDANARQMLMLFETLPPKIELYLSQGRPGIESLIQNEESAWLSALARIFPLKNDVAQEIINLLPAEITPTWPAQLALLNYQSQTLSRINQEFSQQMTELFHTSWQRIIGNFNQQLRQPALDAAQVLEQAGIKPSWQPLDSIDTNFTWKNIAAWPHFRWSEPLIIGSNYQRMPCLTRFVTQIDSSFEDYHQQYQVFLAAWRAWLRLQVGMEIQWIVPPLPYLLQQQKAMQQTRFLMLKDERERHLSRVKSFGTYASAMLPIV